MKQIEDKPRSIKELLQVMLDNQHLFSTGLCKWFDSLLWNNLISHKENHLLIIYLKTHKPSTFNALFIENSHYWKPRYLEPRIKWINKHIKRNS